MDLNLGQPANEPRSGLIKDATTATFMRDVVEASQQTPVIVDFWAPWCGPCKQLTPRLEAAVTAARGAVTMVKVNIDENPEIAQQLRIQSIPAVYAFAGGRPVDGFAGALPDSQVKAFVERLIKAGGGADSPVAEALAKAKQLAEAGDHATAGALYGRILEHEPDNRAAKAGLVRAAVAAGDLARAREILEALTPEERSDPELLAAASALALAEKAADAGDVEGPRRRVAADPSDHQARFELALALYAAGAREEAIDHLVEIVRRDRGWNDEAARKQLLEFFEALGPTDPLTVAGRRKLSAILFS